VLFGLYLSLFLDEPVFALHQGKTYKAKVGSVKFILGKIEIVSFN
jgi:hypothetical protein